MLKAILPFQKKEIKTPLQVLSNPLPKYVGCPCSKMKDRCYKCKYAEATDFVDTCKFCYKNHPQWEVRMNNRPFRDVKICNDCYTKYK